MHAADTICAPATSAGTGAIAVIRVSGPDALAAVDRVVAFRSGTAAAAKGYTVKFGNAAGLDDVLVNIFRAPRSYTGEDAAEISCHASPYIVGALLDKLTEAGCRLAEPGEFTRRAYVNGKMDLAQAEAVADVIAASSAAQHRVAMNQLRGGYSAELRGLRGQLLELTSLLELELDFSEEDVEFADRSRLRALLDTACSHCRQLADSFRLGNAIKNGVPVAIVGAPNSGKSTLLNALLRDDRAIVSDIPGTTRDTVEETCVIDGVLFRFIDTAGIREASDEVERLGIERTFRKIGEAEIVLGVVDASMPQEAVSAAISEIEGRVDPARQKLLILLNKEDKTKPASGTTTISAPDGRREYDDYVRPKPATGTTTISHPDGRCAALRISAKQGAGLDELRAALAARAGVASATGTLVTNARHAAALREAAASLSAVSDGLDRGIPSDLLAEDLRAALTSLGAITGLITTDEVLGEIFSKFCIGK
ncbi:tRNA modification GTPase trmE [Bacteroidales bacterium WCE2004]|nr:tRNA modification GTPase trmE [Bacteroidales bacterium WCE2004]